MQHKDNARRPNREVMSPFCGRIPQGFVYVDARDEDDVMRCVNGEKGVTQEWAHRDARCDLYYTSEGSVRRFNPFRVGIVSDVHPG
jgi:hypothetical protein